MWPLAKYFNNQIKLGDLRSFSTVNTELTIPAVFLILKSLTINTLVSLQETVLLVPQLLHHPPFYRMLDGGEDGGSEEEVHEVDDDKQEDSPWWSHDVGKSFTLAMQMI